MTNKATMPDEVIQQRKDYNHAQKIVEEYIKDFSVFYDTKSVFYIRMYHTDYDERYECTYMVTKKSDRNHFGLINIGTGFVFLDARYTRISFERKLKDKLTLLMQNGIFNAIEVTTK